MSDPTITLAKLARLLPGAPAPRLAPHATALEAARVAGDLITGERVGAFLAQVMTETQGLLHLRENMNYRDPGRLDAMFHAVDGVDDARRLIAKGPEAIANRVYANRLGNGDEASGDGWRFRGGGDIQLTGRENYRLVGEATGMDLEGHPELLEGPANAALAAARFWVWKGCNGPADRNDVVGVTKLINPALAGLDDRKKWRVETRAIWG